MSRAKMNLYPIILVGLSMDLYFSQSDTQTITKKQGLHANIIYSCLRFSQFFQKMSHDVSVNLGSLEIKNDIQNIAKCQRIISLLHRKVKILPIQAKMYCKIEIEFFA